MFIEDEELRTLYRDASTDHLDNLEAGLLHLEKHPDDAAKLTEMLRESHSLKGDSRMLGVQDAETLTHHIEDLLSAVDQGERALTPTLCDCLYQGLDAVRKIAHEAVTGEPSGVSVFYVMAQLMGADDSPSVEPAPEPTHTLSDVSGMPEMPASSLDLAELTVKFEVLETGPDLTELPPAPTPAQTSNGNGHQTPTQPVDLEPEPLVTAATPSQAPKRDTPAVAADDTEVYQIDTIRVEAPKLDTLMTQAGELSVTKLRIARRMDDIAKVLALWEVWTRDTFVNRQMVDSLTGQLDADTLAPLQRFHQLNTAHVEQLGELINQLRGTTYEDTARLETVSNQLESSIQKLRMLPLSSMFNLFPRMVRDLAKQQGKDINLVLEGGDTQADKRILEEMKAPLTHILRNAIDHGIETPGERIAAGKPPTATICLRAYQLGSSIGIDVIDDGRGLDLDSVKRTALRRGLHSEADLARMSVDQIQALIFAPGFSTRTSVTEISGRGVGLDVVRANVERLKGSIQVNSDYGKGCTFRFTLSTSLATTYALIVEVNQTPFAVPVEFVDTMMRVSRDDIFALEGSPTITFQGQPLSIAWLADLLELPVSSPTSTKGFNAVAPSIPCVVIKVGSERLGMLVNDLLEQQDIVLKPHSKLLKRIRNITGATILGNGEVCMVLNPQDLINSARGGAIASAPERAIETDKVKPKVLLVEDSIPIRTQVRRILEGAGYDVTAAVDGLDGFDKLQEDAFDAVVSDVEMPNLTGLELTSRIREYDEYEELPIILVTTLAADEDKRRGADAGANAYITKGDFDQTLLLDTLRRLI